MPEWSYWIIIENQINLYKYGNNFKAASGYKYYVLDQ